MKRYRALVRTAPRLADSVSQKSGLHSLVRAFSLFATCIILQFPASATTFDPADIVGTVSDSPSGAFANGSLDGWEERSFEGNTDYELVTDHETRVLRGHTRQQASILYREQIIDVRKTPVVNWSWKVDRTFKDIDEQTKDGDDFPARLYVVTKIGFLPWETLAINYVWSSHLPIGESWSNPYTDKAKMVVIDSGDTNVGRWAAHSRNVAEDFKTLFDTDIEQIDGFAVMVDGDNSKKESVAWFGEISFSPAASTSDAAN